MIPGDVKERIELATAECSHELSKAFREQLIKLCEASYTMGHAQGYADASRRTSPTPEEPNGQQRVQ